VITPPRRNRPRPKWEQRRVGSSTSGHAMSRFRGGTAVRQTRASLSTSEAEKLESDFLVAIGVRLDEAVLYRLSSAPYMEQMWL
jgi:hypothetical protein